MFVVFAVRFTRGDQLTPMDLVNRVRGEVAINISFKLTNCNLLNYLRVFMRTHQIILWVRGTR